ncbi:MAG: MEDS domain-containing protein [Methylophilus sp.]|uniref:MEDS domain-containing protein n=1 Tax=Methylophilus sp. TaxID=29541 RepID=UPI003FA051FB
MSSFTLAGTPLTDHFHVCAFFNSKADEYDVLLPFYAEAHGQGEKTLHLVNPANEESHKSRLNAYGMNVPELEESGQLEVMTWQSSYLNGEGRFERSSMLTKLIDARDAATEAGFPRLRVVGDMDWVFLEDMDFSGILSYEAEVNEFLIVNKQPAVCVYDIAKLSGSMMMDLLRTHPLTLVNGVVQENPFYTPASQMLEELNARSAPYA